MGCVAYDEGLGAQLQKSTEECVSKAVALRKKGISQAYPKKEFPFLAMGASVRISIKYPDISPTLDDTSAW